MAAIFKQKRNEKILFSRCLQDTPSSFGFIKRTLKLNSIMMLNCNGVTRQTNRSNAQHLTVKSGPSFATQLLCFKLDEMK